MDNMYICYIGRPSYQKNTFFLLDVVRETAKRHPEVKFMLLGLGFYSPDLERMKQIINMYNLQDKIELHSWLGHEETLKYVKKSLFYLTVARYEGLPLSVIEAMSLGKAIIASDVVGNRDCIKDGYNGYLLQMDAKVFSDKICYLIENSNEREVMGNNSRLLFEKKFLIDNRIHKLEEIYNKFAGI